MSGKTIGYMRVSTVFQNEARQKESIGKVEKMFLDKASGKSKDRPRLKEMLEYVRDGDSVIVHSMDRLARNLVDLRMIVDNITKKGACVKFIKENLEFTSKSSPMNQLILGMLGAVAEFERSIILERQREGIELAKQRGVYKGRKPSLNKEQVEEVRVLANTGVPIAKIARDFGVSRTTVYATLVGKIEKNMFKDNTKAVVAESKC